MKQTATNTNQAAPISLAFMFANLAHAVDRAEKESIAVPKMPRKPPSDLTQLRLDVLSWIKQVKQATCGELSKKFEVTPVRMSRVLTELKRTKHIKPLVKKRNPVWVVA